jgi:hypothetical protein
MREGRRRCRGEKRKRRKKTKKKNGRNLVSAGVERKEKKEKIIERNLVYLDLCYFGIIF